MFIYERVEANEFRSFQRQRQDLFGEMEQKGLSFPGFEMYSGPMENSIHVTGCSSNVVKSRKYKILYSFVRTLLHPPCCARNQTIDFLSFSSLFLVISIVLVNTFNAAFERKFVCFISDLYTRNNIEIVKNDTLQYRSEKNIR